MSSLYRHLLQKASPTQTPERIDTFIPNTSRNYTRSMVKKLCGELRILAGSVPVKASYLVKPGDEIYILLPYASYGEKPAAVSMDLSILFEDEGIIVVDKPAGIAVHPGLGDHQGSLVNGLLHHTGGKGSLYIVHRLDKHTSGPIVIAKSMEALEFLQKQFIAHTVKRVYHCIAWGRLSQAQGRIETYIGRNPLNEMQICVSADRSFGKQAVTRYRVLEYFDEATLVECILETGRTHQIRIHMQHIGHALVSDQRYPQKNAAAQEDLHTETSVILPHQALHATELSFVNPTGKAVLSFSSPWPPAFGELIAFFREKRVN